LRDIFPPDQFGFSYTTWKCTSRFLLRTFNQSRFENPFRALTVDIFFCFSGQHGSKWLAARRHVGQWVQYNALIAYLIPRGTHFEWIRFSTDGRRRHDALHRVKFSAAF